MMRIEQIWNPGHSRRRRAGLLAGGIACATLFTVVGSGCVAANDMSGESVPSNSREIEDLDRARAAGAIDEADYLELRRGLILAD